VQHHAAGVVLHTNLGRAPLAPAAIAAMARAAAGYANVEYDLERGARGSRHAICRTLLRELTGAEDALVVNNAAGALLLALSALARDGEAIVSRGELVEIGGAFRIPDIMARSGATLVEVGTTNRTHRKDYEAALTARTRVVMKVHRSNFQLTGFTAEVPAREIAAVARGARGGGTASLFDLGSGLLLDLSPWGLSGEPTVGEALTSGVGAVRQVHASRPGGDPRAVSRSGNRAARHPRTPDADRRRRGDTAARRGVAARRRQRHGARRGRIGSGRRIVPRGDAQDLARGADG